MKANRLGLTLARRPKAPEHAAALQAKRSPPPPPEHPWSDADVALMRLWYDGHADTALNRAGLAALLGRTRAAISHKAARLGLRGPPGRWSDETPHPRGALGMKHTAVARTRIGASNRARMAALTPDERAAHILPGLKAKAALGTLVRPRPNASWTQGHRTIGGRRIYFRSKWEMNYARYLQWLAERGEIAAWAYEPDTFWFEQVRRGTRCYIPDFRVTETSGRVAYHEVKGWMDARSATKLKRMKKYHPNVTIVVVDGAAYKQISVSVGRLVPGWE